MNKFLSFKNIVRGLKEAYEANPDIVEDYDKGTYREIARGTYEEMKFLMDVTGLMYLKTHIINGDDEDNYILTLSPWEYDIVLRMFYSQFPEEKSKADLSQEIYGFTK